MTLANRIRHGAALLADHPALIGWYVRNKLRVATVAFERDHLEGVSRFTRGITFRLTSACNLRCKMCRFVESGEVLSDMKQTLPIETWKAIVDDVARYRPYFTLTGGEPLICPWIGELITHISKQDMRCTLTTNGTLLAKRAPDFMDNPPDMVIVSVDGPPDVHNEIRGQPKVFERAVEGIKAVQRLRIERNTKAPLLAINCSITPWSYECVEEMVEVARDLGVDALNFQHQWSITQRMVDEHNAEYGEIHPLCAGDLGASDPPPVDLDKMVAVLGRIRERARQSVEPIITFHPELDDSEVRDWYSDPHIWVQRRPAACAWMNTEIGPNGDVEPCYGVVCGNVKEEPFSKIWNSFPYRKFRRRLSATEDFPICVRCCAFFRRD